MLFLLPVAWVSPSQAASTDTGHTGVAPPEHTGLPPTHTADTGATADTGPDPDTDADEDGWSLGEGDCDDANDLVSPGQPEVCFDRIDNDCSSLVDDLCDNSARLGSLRGGGACTSGGNIAGTATAVAPLLLLVGLRRRNSR